MGMDLVNDKGQERFNIFGWRKMIDLALRYGWRPAGALEPDEEEDLDEEDEEVCQNKGAESPQVQQQPCEMCPVDPLAVLIRSLLDTGDPLLDTYFYNAGYLVTREDASALADALERALPDIPNHDALENKTVTTSDGCRALPISVSVNPFEWFSGERKAHLVSFIEFCRQGEFEIW